MTAQFLMFAAIMLSLATLADCSFVSIEDGVEIPIPEVFPDVTTDRLGLFTFERPNGTCYWYAESNDPGGQIRAYFDFLGSDWEAARVFGFVAASLGILLAMFSWSLCCSSHVWSLRMFMAFLFLTFMPALQGLTFFVFTSDFCKENACEVSRSGYWSIASACFFYASGLMFFFMQNYPGKRVVIVEEEFVKPLEEEKRLEQEEPLPDDEEAGNMQESESITEETPIAPIPVPQEEQSDQIDEVIDEVTSDTMLKEEEKEPPLPEGDEVKPDTKLKEEEKEPPLPGTDDEDGGIFEDNEESFDDAVIESNEQAGIDEEAKTEEKVIDPPPSEDDANTESSSVIGDPKPNPFSDGQ